jgi:PilZ domain-containing protein
LLLETARVERRFRGYRAGLIAMLNFKPRAKAENRRRSERHAISGLAKIQLGTGSLPRDCWITDISDGGVRLHCEVDVPDQFVLVLPGVNGRRECRVAWRLGHELGAEFIEPFAPGFAHQVAGGRR